MLVIQGKNIDSSAIEQSILATSPSIIDAVTFTLVDSLHNTLLCYCITYSGDALSLPDLKIAINHKIYQTHGGLLARLSYISPTIPKNRSGKILRSIIRASASNYNYFKPLNIPTELVVNSANFQSSYTFINF